MTIAVENPQQPDIVRLLRNGEALAARLYPAESNHHLSLEALQRSEVRFVVARDPAGNALATGALVLNGQWAEIKRMWVEERARGRGISKQILEFLILVARENGITTLRLETGVASHAALSLYKGTGFRVREPFADYEPDPLSVFMERVL